MKKSEIRIGHCYEAKVSDRVVAVRIDSANSRGGWNATNTATGKRIHVKTAQRLRRAVDDAAPAHRRTRAAAAQVTPADEGLAAARAEAAEDAVSQEPAGEPKRLSALAAAAQVLQAAGRPLRVKEMLAEMTAQGLWSSPNGKTPEASLYAAIIREIAAKGAAARFCKVERGQFARAAV